MEKAIHVCEDWWALNLLKQSSFFKPRAIQGQWKDKKTLKYKRTFLFFKSQKVAIYLLMSLIKIWETFINSSICPFLYMAFFLALPYTLYKATSHFVEVCFWFAQTSFCFSLSLLGFIINWSQTFINAYKLYFVLVHNVYIAPINVELQVRTK